MVIGGGLLGLEAANALQDLGLETHVVEFAPRLMALQLDEAGGARAAPAHREPGRRRPHRRQRPREIARSATTARCAALALRRRRRSSTTDMVRVLRRHPPARRAGARGGLAIGERGGIVIDERCRTSRTPTSTPSASARLCDGRIYGLVAPGYQMARVAAAQRWRATSDALRRRFDMSTKLKLMGVDVASFGDAFGADAGAARDQLVDTQRGGLQEAGRQRRRQAPAGRHAGRRRRRLRPAAAAGAEPHRRCRRDPETADPAARRAASRRGLGVDALPDAAQICSCNNVSKGADLRAPSREQKLTAVGAVKSCTKAGTGCGSLRAAGHARS